MSETLRLEQVSLVLGSTALDNATMTLSEGEHAHIACGAGEASALLNLLATLDRPAAGRVLVDGMDIHALTETQAAAWRARTLGVCRGDPALYSGLTVWENAALPLTLAGQTLTHAKPAALDILDALSVGYAAHALPDRLSPYEAALVAVARALIHGPKLLLFESFAAGLSALDAQRLGEALAAQPAYVQAAALFLGGEGSPADKHYVLADGTLREVVA